jgi:hypothetical protein
MDAIQEPNSKFDFEQLVLSPPISASSGNHFIKYSYHGNPLYIQTPKCKIKQGVVKAGKKMYCDLMFSIENEELTQWLENLETNSQKYIYEKREKWFETTLEKHDIENSFTSLVKLIKSGKCYTLRSNIPMILGKPSLKIYNESEELLTLEDLKDDMPVISILEIQGVKCSPRGFQIEIEIKQLLVLNPPDIFQKCILIPKDTHRSGEPAAKSVQHVNNDTANKSRPILEVSGADQDEPTGSLETEEALEPETVEDTPIKDEPEQNVDSKAGEADVDKEGEGEDQDQDQDQDQDPVQDPSDAFTENHHLTEIDFNLEEIPAEDSLILKKRNDVYYEMYREALRKAKMAKEMAVSSYLEAKRIKNIYMLDDLSDEESEEDEDEETGFP